MAGTCAARCTWTRRRHGQAQGEERAPGGADLGAVRGRRPAAHRADQRVRRAALALRRGPQLPHAGERAPLCASDRQAQPGGRPAGRVEGPFCPRPSQARGGPLQERRQEGKKMSMPALPSTSSGTSSVPLLGDTIGANLDRTAARVGEHEALVEGATRRRWSYPQLVADVDACALGLDALGVGKGDRVGIWAPNCAEWAFVQYGTAKLGAILVNINPAYRTHELSYVLKQAGISVLVSAPEFKGSDYRAMVAEVRGECPDLREVLFLGDPEWEQLLATGRAADRELLVRRETELSADDPINIQYTSGTTGFPKGATLTHHNLLNNGFFVGEGCGYTEADRICVPVPYYHCFGMGMGNLGATSHGATIVIPAPGFDPALTLQAVQ